MWAQSVKTHLHSQSQQVAPPGGPSYKRSTTETDRNRLQQYHGRVIGHPKPSVSTRTPVTITYHMKRCADGRGLSQGPTNLESETLPTELSGPPMSLPTLRCAGVPVRKIVASEVFAKARRDETGFEAVVPWWQRKMFIALQT